MRSIRVPVLGSASRYAPGLEHLERSHQDSVAGHHLVHEGTGGWAEDRVDDLLYHSIRGLLEEAALFVVPVDRAHTLHRQHLGVSRDRHQEGHHRRRRGREQPIFPAIAPRLKGERTSAHTVPIKWSILSVSQLTERCTTSVYT